MTKKKQEAPAKEEVKKQEAPAKEGKAKLKEVTIKCHNAAGKYGLPYNYGMKAKIEEKQAFEMIEAKDAE